MAAKRPRREARAPERLGDLKNVRAVDAALADLGEQLSESESEHELEQELQAPARSGRGRGKAPRPAVPASRAETAELVSHALIAVPPLVDLLIEEDAVRCVTLVARDAANLQRALGGGVDLAPIWAALATRVRQKKLAADAAAAAAATAAAADAAAGGDAAMQEAAGEAGAAPTPEGPPTKRAQRARRRGKAAAPRPPSDLAVVQAAVVADPARTADLKRSTAMYQYRISAKNLQGVETHVSSGRYNAAHIWELDARAAAWRKHGDEARLKAYKQVQQERAKQRQDTWDKRQQQKEEERQELLALRVAEEGLPASVLEPSANGYWELNYWLQGWDYSNDHLEVLLAPIIERHRDQAAKEERTRRLDESLAAEGLGAFKRDWRYTCFIASGELDGLEALLGVARRQAVELQAGFDRARELDERLEAAGLPLREKTAAMRAWLETGEGDVGAEVAAARARTDRELALAELLALNGLGYKHNAPACVDFIWGRLPPETGAQDVVQQLLNALATGHERTTDRLAALLARLEAERLPPTLLDHPTARAYLRNSSITLGYAVLALRTAAYQDAGMRVPPPGRPWLGEADSDEVQSWQGGASSVEGSAREGAAEEGWGER